MFAGLMLLLSSFENCEHSTDFAAKYAVASDPKNSFERRRTGYEEAIRACPDNPQLYSQISALLTGSRKFDAALSWAAKGLKLSPADPELRIQKAAALLPVGRPREALSALASIPSGEARFYAGLAYRQLHDHAQSRQSFLAAWDLGYRNAYVLYSTIQEDYALGDKPGGLKRFQLLLETFPDSAWMHLLLADAYFTKEENGKARDEYVKALTIKPDLLEANFRLGYLAFQSGERESAAAYFAKEVAANPAYVDAHVFLAETLIALDRKQAALVELRKALALEPGSELTYKRLATILIETNQLQDATRILKDAERRFPKDPAFPAQQARVFTILNQPEDAQAAAERARKLTVEQHRKQEIAPVQ